MSFDKNKYKPLYTYSINMGSLFDSSTICFVDEPHPEIKIIPIRDDEIYASCVIHTDSIAIPSHPILFHFMVDVSGSMSDATENGRTKMQLIIHTLTNMINYFAENTQNISIQVKGFDDTIHRCIDLVKVDEGNVHKLVANLTKLRPMQMTNIGLALHTMKSDIEAIASTSEIAYRQVGIFLTDGDPTAGETHIDVLGHIIPSSVPFHFIALGKQHNPYLMHHLGHRTQYTNNWFINDLEQTGNVYGEIIYNELHRVAENVSLEVRGGRIYEYYTNQFVTHLQLGSIYADTEKHYHILAENDQCVVYLRGSYCGDNASNAFEVIVSEIPPLYTQKQQENCVEFQHCQPFFHTIQYYRLGAQMHMAKSRILYLDTTIGKYKLEVEEKFDMFQQLDGRHRRPKSTEKAKIYLSDMEKFMERFDLNENEYMKSLCDDIRVLIHTAGSAAQIKYCALREDIQGQERTSNTVTDIDDSVYGEIVAKPALSRCPTTPYRTTGRIGLMDTMSQNTDNMEPALTPPSATNPAHIQTNFATDIFSGFHLTPPPVLRRSRTTGSSSAAALTLNVEH